MTDPDIHRRSDPYQDTDHMFDVQDYSGRRSMILLLVCLFILLLLAIFAFRLYASGMRDPGDPPRISQANTPVKIVPKDVGGVTTPDQDRAIYDVLDGTNDNETVTVEPSTEAPVPVPKQNQGPKIERPNSANIVLNTDTNRQPSQLPQATTSPPGTSSQAQTSTQPPTQPTRRPQNTSSTTPSGYVVQVASVRSEAQARELWNSIKAKHGAVIPSTVNSAIVRADLGDRGIYYRLRIVGLSGNAEAKRICDALQARGQACFVTR